jgi:hypothetical protein
VLKQQTLFAHEPSDAELLAPIIKAQAKLLAKWRRERERNQREPRRRSVGRVNEGKGG